MKKTILFITFLMFIVGSIGVNALFCSDVGNCYGGGGEICKWNAVNKFECVGNRCTQSSLFPETCTGGQVCKYTVASGYTCTDCDADEDCKPYCVEDRSVFFDGTESCSGGLCSFTETPCGTGTLCTEAFSADGSAECKECEDNFDCRNNNYCDGSAVYQETCSGSGTCTPNLVESCGGATPVCSSGECVGSAPPLPACTDADNDGWCAESNGDCDPTGICTVGIQQCNQAECYDDCEPGDVLSYPGGAEGTYALCSDNKDNDCDGKQNCADEDCDDPLIVYPAAAGARFDGLKLCCELVAGDCENPGPCGTRACQNNICIYNYKKDCSQNGCNAGNKEFCTDGSYDCSVCDTDLCDAEQGECDGDPCTDVDTDDWCKEKVGTNCLGQATICPNGLGDCDDDDPLLTGDGTDDDSDVNTRSCNDDAAGEDSGNYYDQAARKPGYVGNVADCDDGDADFMSQLLLFEDKDQDTYALNQGGGESIDPSEDRISKCVGSSSNGWYTANDGSGEIWIEEEKLATNTGGLSEDPDCDDDPNACGNACYPDDEEIYGEAATSDKIGICTDTYDNDCDDKIDCLDEDCFSGGARLYYPDEYDLHYPNSGSPVCSTDGESSGCLPDHYCVKTGTASALDVCTYSLADACDDGNGINTCPVYQVSGGELHFYCNGVDLDCVSCGIGACEAEPFTCTMACEGDSECPKGGEPYCDPNALADQAESHEWFCRNMVYDSEAGVEMGTCELDEETCEEVCRDGECACETESECPFAGESSCISTTTISYGFACVDSGSCESEGTSECSEALFCSPQTLNCVEFSEICFLPGTKITMGDGSYKNIEDVKVGDEVLSYNTLTKGNQASKVTATIINPAESYLVLNDNIEVTDEHLFYVEGEWIAASELEIGSKLRDVEGNYVEVETIEVVVLDEIIKVYNMEVESTRTYYAEGVLVHNQYDVPELPFNVVAIVSLLVIICAIIFVVLKRKK